MKICRWLFALALASASAGAIAAPPSYNFFERDYSHVKRDDPSYDYQGGSGRISALLANYLFVEGGYEFPQSNTFRKGLVKGRLQEQTHNAGLGLRLPLVYDLLDLDASADYLHANIRQKDGFEDIYPDQDSNGWQARIAARLNLPYFEAIPSVRYVHIFDDHDWAFGGQLLACPGYGVCLTGGYEYLKDSKDKRIIGGIRFYYD